VPLDKSEGPVKQKTIPGVPEHRFVGHRTLSKKTLESTFTRITYQWKVLLLLLLAVPPTIDSAQPRP
jgi:hypothetical protein